MIYSFDRDFITHGAAFADLLVPDQRYIPVRDLGWGFPITYDGPTPLVGRQTNTGRLNDMFIVNLACGISERLKDIIESVEPGIHQYLPLLMLQRNGKPFEEKYFILNICQSFEADIFPDLSLRVFRKASSPFERPEVQYYDGERLLSAPQIAGRHLWARSRPSFGTGSNTNAYMSETMFKAWKGAKVKYFDHKIHRPIALTDKSWIADEQIPEAVAWFKQTLADIKNGEGTERVDNFIRLHKFYKHWLKIHKPDIHLEFAQHIPPLLSDKRVPIRGSTKP